MCRHIAWLGAPRTLSSLLLEPEHGLLRQSYAPRRQRHGLMNADGWGAGWWSSGVAEPARWRAARPFWADASFTSVAPHVTSPAVLAAVRSATVGMPLDETAAAPFSHGGWLLSHNGRVDRSKLPGAAWTRAESVCDSAVLASWLLEEPAELAHRVREVGGRDPDARLNILAGDGNPLTDPSTTSEPSTPQGSLSDDLRRRRTATVPRDAPAQTDTDCHVSASREPRARHDGIWPNDVSATCHLGLVSSSSP